MTQQQEDYQLIVDVWRLLKAYGQPDGSDSQIDACVDEAQRIAQRYGQSSLAIDLLTAVQAEICVRIRRRLDRELMGEPV